MKYAVTATSPGSVVSHAFSRLPEFVVVQIFVVSGDRIIVFHSSWTRATRHALCAVRWMLFEQSGVLLWTGAQSSKSIHSIILQLNA
jgi:hypothetical protein